MTLLNGQMGSEDNQFPVALANESPPSRFLHQNQNKPSMVPLFCSDINDLVITKINII